MFDASEMITQREVVSQKVMQDLTTRVKNFGLLLDDISLVNWFFFQSHSKRIKQFVSLFFQTHLTFGTEFMTAVELKQVAQQEAERARYMVEKVTIGINFFTDYF